MSTSSSQIFKSSVAQSFAALNNILTKAKDHAESLGTEESAFLDNRLTPDMHPMKWQVQMISEFAVRGGLRLTGVQTEDMPDMPFTEDSFDDLLARVAKCNEAIVALDDAALDKSVDAQISMPVGPEETMDLDGRTYLLSFFLPNLNFHVAMAYSLLRGQGVPIGKRDFMGM